MVRDDLGNRMKQYETVPKSRLIQRMPVIIRIDGKAFHTFTKGFKRPFDMNLIVTMQDVTKYLCENIQGCVLGYTQSDEITLVLVDYKKFTSSSWFDSEVQKMCSIAASMATMTFNKIFKQYASNDMYKNALEKGAMFDARVFNIPKEEVTNNIYWRQLDASRNSIQMLGQAHFSHKQLQNQSCSNIQDMLMEEKGINWNDLQIHQKRGTCVVKDESSDRSKWKIDTDVPIFKGEGREYIDKLIYVGEE